MISTRARGGTREEGGGGGGGGSGNQDGGGDGDDLLQGLEQSTEKLETSNVSVASDGRGRARRSERRDSFSREEEDSRDPPQTGPRRGNTAVGRSVVFVVDSPAGAPPVTPPPSGGNRAAV